MSKIYTIIGGVNGVGKSSLTGVLAQEHDDLGAIIDTDRITAEMGGNALAGGKEAIRRINLCLEAGLNFTQETTLSGVRIEKTIRQASDNGYKIRLYYIGLNDVDESLKRIANRVSKGGHNIPSDDVSRRYNERFSALVKILPLCNEAYFYDNDNGFVNIAEYRNGKLLLKGDYAPKWIRELKLFFSEYQFELLADSDELEP